MPVSSSFDTMFGVALIAYIPLIVSGLAVGIKRLHDRDKSGWWLLLFYLGAASDQSRSASTCSATTVDPQLDPRRT